MSTKIGNRAEDSACLWLKHQGFKIIDRNWKTRTCEIDIVCEKDFKYYFIEVKYRINSNFGSSLDYLTPVKFKQMFYSANKYIHTNNIECQSLLAVICIKSDYKFEDFRLLY